MQRKRNFSLLVLFIVPILSLLAAPGCCIRDCDDDSQCKDEPVFSARLRLVDESGSTILNGQYVVGQNTYLAGSDGIIVLSPFIHPVMGLARSEGKIDEPVAVGWSEVDSVMTVPLLDRTESRWVYHAGGDSMFGRRYLEPEEGLPLLSANDDGESAARLVSNISDIFSAADLRTLNLETVVGDLDESLIYPGKRWILNSLPNSMAALAALRVDLTILANNHQRDFLEPGMAATMDALSRFSLPFQGGGMSREQAEETAFLDVKNLTIALLGFTTVDGDYVNDNYPTDSAEEPGGVPVEDQWMWEKRLWGFSGGDVDIPAEERRLGSAWSLFEAAEASVDDQAVVADLWASLETVYPEMQDWVARRGHGGAMRWQDEQSIARIEDAAATADVVIVQLHSGFQFMPSPSGNATTIAHEAIDAGADIVICHHPHVIQGFSWYKDKLIAFSLGNFIFDQNFFSTFNTFTLRTVWDGNELIQARVLPMQLDGYVPVYVADAAADFVLADLWRKSLMETACNRDFDKYVYAERTKSDPDTRLPLLQMENHAASIWPGLPEVQSRVIRIEAGQAAVLDSSEAINRRIGEEAPDNLQLGMDLFGWGGFEDMDTDSAVADMTHWDYEAAEYRKVVSEGCASGRNCVYLRRNTDNESNLILRPLARIPLFAHRFYDKVNNAYVPADGPATYSVRMLAKTNQANDAYVRLDLYHFDDLDPTVAPESALVREVWLPLNLQADGKWHELVLDVAPEDLEPENPDEPINFILPYINLPVPEQGEVRLWVDDFAVVEWRDGDEMPEGYGLYNFIRTTDGKPAEVEVEFVSGRR